MTEVCANVLTSSTRHWCIGCWRPAKEPPARIAKEQNPAARENLNLKTVASRELYSPSNRVLAEKVKELHLERDYKKYLYFV